MAAGVARVASRHLAGQGEASLRAAEAVECAGDQGRYRAYRAALYAADPARGPARFAPAALKGYAADLGLDGEQFAACVDGRRHRARVEADIGDGRRRGVESTPTFIVGDERIVGIPAPGQLTALLERRRP